MKLLIQNIKRLKYNIKELLKTTIRKNSTQKNTDLLATDKFSLMIRKFLEVFIRFNSFKAVQTTFFLLLFVTLSIGQREVDISKYLEQVSQGQSDAVRGILPSLIKNNPQSFSLKYLEALLTVDGKQAASLYKDIVHSKSNSEYKNDALFKLYQFHYALGEFNESDKYARMLLDSYPSSEFISRLKKSDLTATQSGSQKPVESKIPEKENQQKLSTENFTIQVGAFLDKRNAESLLIQVLKYGESWITEREVRGKIFYVVMVGKFSNESDANTVLERMTSERNLNGVILNIQ